MALETLFLAETDRSSDKVLLLFLALKSAVSRKEVTQVSLPWVRAPLIQVLVQVIRVLVRD